MAGPSISHGSSLAARSVDESRLLKVAVIGAGISGLLAGIEFSKLPNLQLQIYEKNSDIGGVWFENQYPGVACGR